MEGALSEFGLAEILQLVAMQHKTGLLRVESYEKTLTFYFKKGILVSCRDRRHVGGDPLLDYMKKTGYLDAWRTLHLSLEVEENRRDVADVLLEQNLITEEELQDAMVDMAHDLVFRTYNWKEGTYRFLSGEDALRGLQYGMSLKMEAVLLEAARRVDEWPGLLTKLPSPQVLLAPVGNLPESLDARSHGLLSRIQGPMRLAELMACARMPEYDVYEIVAAALDAGFTRILETPRAPEVTEGAPVADAALSHPIKGSSALFATESARPAGKPGAGNAFFGFSNSGGKTHRLPGALRRQPRHTVAFWCLVALIAGIGTWCFVSGYERNVLAQQDLEIHEARETLLREIEVYRALMGRYPEKLEDLSTANLAGAGLIDRARVSDYSVGPRGESFHLEHAPEQKTPPGSGSSYR